MNIKNRLLLTLASSALLSCAIYNPASSSQPSIDSSESLVSSDASNSSEEQEFSSPSSESSASSEADPSSESAVPSSSDSSSEAKIAKTIVLTSENLGLTTSADLGTVSIDGYSFDYVNLFNSTQYNGYFQVKKETEDFLSNVTSLGGNATIAFVCIDRGDYGLPPVVKSGSAWSSVTEEVSVSSSSLEAKDGKDRISYTCEVGSYFSFSTTNYAMYIESITIGLHEGYIPPSESSEEITSSEEEASSEEPIFSEEEASSEEPVSSEESVSSEEEASSGEPISSESAESSEEEGWTTVTLTSTAMELTTKYASGSVTIDGIEFSYVKAMQSTSYGENIQLPKTSKGPTGIYNVTELSEFRITLTCTVTMDPPVIYAGDSSYPTEGAIELTKSEGENSSDVYTGSGTKFFTVTSSTSACYFKSIVIQYK